MAKQMTKVFFKGIKEMSPIIIAVVPFGAVMGTVCAEAKLTLFQAVTMNLLVFAGAAQLASVELMTKNTEAAVVLATGLIINLRFMLYSAAISPVVQKSRFLTKAFVAYFLTDQSYSAMNAYQDKLKSNEEAVVFYFGTALCMSLAWHLSVIAGYTFGNFAPAEWALDYAVPLSFVALIVPTIRNRIYVCVAAVSSVLSLLFKPLPFNFGLILAAVLALLLGVYLTRKAAAK